MGREDQGATPERWTVIPRVLCFLFHGDSVLLMRRSPTKRIWPGRYNGLGGHVEPGEDLRTAARREIAEESGLEGVALRLAGTVLIDTGEAPGVMLAVFVGRAPGRAVREGPEGALEWVPLHRVPELPTVADFPILWPHVLRFLETGEPFFLSYCYDEEDRLEVREG